MAREQGLPELFLIEGVFREAMLTAEMTFVRQLAKDLRTGALSGTKGWRRMHELVESGLTFEQIMADPVAHLGEEGRALAPADPQT